MPRATHYLRKSRHAGFPRRHIYLQLTWHRAPVPHMPGRARDQLASWSAVCWDGGPGEEKWRDGAEGTTAETWWRWLGRQLARGLCPWVWIDGAIHALTLLGFWERLDVGEYYLSRRDCEGAGQGAGADEKDFPGICILEDPPTIILASATDRRRSFKIVDVRNLGDDRDGVDPDCRLGARDRALWLQQWARTVDALKLGGLRATAAAQAWHGWRHSYLDEGVLIHGNPEISRLERDAIHPGRAEAFRLGRVGGPITCLDAAAHYPACATSGKLPVRCKWHGKASLPDLGRAASRGWLAIARCRIRADRPMLPCRRDGLTIWPVGEWSVTLAGPEIELARERGALLSVDACALYEGGMPCERYVRTLWDERERATGDGDAARRECVKRLMNALIGKWAAHGRAWTDAPGEALLAPWHQCEKPYGPERKLHRYRSIGWHVQRLDISDETDESCPALAAWTYSVGRCRLQGWMDTAGREETYYVDSDCLYTSARGSRALEERAAVRPGVMGALRVQGVYPSLRIGGIRDYSAGGRTVRAGAPKGAVPTGGGPFDYWSSESVKEAVERERRPAADVRLVTVPASRAYRHGRVDAGGRVHPIDVGVMP